MGVLYNFESPRIGNPQFTEFFHSMFPNSIRITHNNDMVVHLPPESLGFKHRSNEIWYNEAMDTYTECDGSGEDPKCAD